MSTDSELKGLFKKQLGAEVRARDLYTLYVQVLKDKELSGDLESIRKDEVMHIAICKKLIGLLK